MRILIAGASGYIGAALSAALSARSHDVTGTSRSREGFTKLDVTDLAACVSLMESGGFDAVVNLAAVGVTAGTASAREMAVVNSRGASTLAQAAAAVHDAPWFMHVASSTEAKGNGVPESQYSATKSEGTAGALKVLEAAGVPHSHVVIHNTYGATQPSGRFLADAVATLRSGSPLFIRFPGRVRDFCYLDDVVTGLVGIVERGGSTSTSHEVGTGVGTTLIDAARMICRELGVPVSMVGHDEHDSVDLHAVQVADPDRPDFVRCPSSLETGIAQALKAGWGTK